jgi:hypothetical protein
VDRLDTWLNAQRGWRRFWLLWLNLYPIAMCLGVITMGWQGLTGSEPPGPAFIFWSLALSVPGALLLTVLVLLTRRRYERRAVTRGKIQKPLFFWRMTGYIFLLISAMTIQQFGMTQPHGWRHHHQVLDVTALVCLVCGMVLLFDGLRYAYRLRRLDSKHRPIN